MKKVLIVDDSPTFRKYMSQAIEFLGVEILQAEDGLVALDVVNAKEGKIDLILLDFFMPNMDGFEFFQSLQKSERDKGIPVIMITSAVDKKKMIEAVRLGIKHYLTKPFSMEDFLTKVVKVLDLDI